MEKNSRKNFMIIIYEKMRKKDKTIISTRNKAAIKAQQRNTWNSYEQRNKFKKNYIHTKDTRNAQSNATISHRKKIYSIWSTRYTSKKYRKENWYESHAIEWDKFIQLHAIPYYTVCFPNIFINKTHNTCVSAQIWYIEKHNTLKKLVKSIINN